MRAPVAIAAAAAAVACSGAMQSPAARGDAMAGTPRSPAAQARADGGRPPYTAADARFVQGMIAHHAQALVMTQLARTRARRGDVRTLAERIDVSQRDEIAFMQGWLRDRGEPVPDPAAPHDMADHHAPPSDAPGSAAPLPGMLTAAQLARLEAAQGAEFDRLFLTLMIQHHEGALAMVHRLFATPGAGQDAEIFRFASDVEADQTTEIDRMRTMLSAQPAAGGRP